MPNRAASSSAPQNKHGANIPNRGRGRPKGTPNKTTARVKEAILLAYQGAGGDKAFTQWAKDFPTEFYTRVLTRILPTEVTGEAGGPVEIAVRFTRESLHG